MCATGFVVGSGFVDRETEVYFQAPRETDYLTFDSLGTSEVEQTGDRQP